MLDFDTAHVELLNWYRLGNPSGTRAFERFYREWLAPKTKSIANRCRIPPDEVDDVLQQLASDFADRDKMLGLEAKSATFWCQRIKWQLETARRRARLHTKRYHGKHETKLDADGKEQQPPQIESPEPLPDALFADADETAARAKAVRAALPNLSQMERLSYLVFTWPDHAELMSPDDLSALAVRSNCSEAEVLNALDAALAYREDSNQWSRATAAIAYNLKSESTPDEWSRGLDAYRKARTRAVLSLQGALKGILDGGAL